MIISFIQVSVEHLGRITAHQLSHHVLEFKVVWYDRDRRRYLEYRQTIIIVAYLNVYAHLKQVVGGAGRQQR